MAKHYATTEIRVDEPSLVFFPRPRHHRLIAETDDNAELVCASLEFDGGTGNPLAHALPDHLVIALSSAPSCRRQSTRDR